jgi:hypothetical protein
MKIIFMPNEMRRKNEKFYFFLLLHTHTHSQVCKSSRQSINWNEVEIERKWTLIFHFRMHTIEWVFNFCDFSYVALSDYTHLIGRVHSSYWSCKFWQHFKRAIKWKFIALSLTEWVRGQNGEKMEEEKIKLKLCASSLFILHTQVDSIHNFHLCSWTVCVIYQTLSISPPDEGGSYAEYERLLVKREEAGIWFIWCSFNWQFGLIIEYFRVNKFQ